MKGRVAFAAIAVMCAGVAFAEAVVKASSFGFDPEDATEILQKALDSGARKIVIDKQASPWITRPLFARSNCEIVFEGGVEVVAKKGAFLGKGDSLLTLDRVENVKVSASGGGTVAHHVPADPFPPRAARCLRPNDLRRRCTCMGIQHAWRKSLRYLFRTSDTLCRLHLC